ncbi:uncharacterized protein LOC131225307 [Magnolia sinica]|uniref:uncharacterized protein LOC131225307 n=1 Tax=Magnolia sinica TaxID=86752 RepID=UPI0026595460|nr:uncharacterized protein LOC131225307 [Magnolia sinica]
MPDPLASPRSYPLALRVEDQLQKLQARETSSSSAHLTVEMLWDSLRGLGDFNNFVLHLLQSPLTQQALICNGSDTWLNEMLDGSLKILDLCETTKDVFKLMKEDVQTLLSNLRRRRVSEKA